MINKRHRYSIALISVLTVSMLAITIPSIKSAVMDRQITLLIAAAPQTVGVGEAVQILCWSDIYPNTYVPSNSSVGPGSLIYPRFHDFTFTITHPNGNTETKTFPETDPLGANYFNYVPSEVGTYTVVCNYPGESFVGDVSFNADVNFLPAISKTVTFTAQE